MDAIAPMGREWSQSVQEVPINSKKRLSGAEVPYCTSSLSLVYNQTSD